MAETPITLTVIDNLTSQKTNIPITYRDYNRLYEGGYSGFRWTRDNRMVMFDLFSEPYPDMHEEDFTCFVAVDVIKLAPITINYSGMGVWIGEEDDYGMVWLEHGGLNEIYDYFIPGTNCYKYTQEGECVSSYISPSGQWELFTWGGEGFDIQATSLSGESWKYSYPDSINTLDNPVTMIQRWSEDEQYVLFSPSVWHGMSWARGLFRMDLSTGNVISLIGEDSYYFLAVSPRARKYVYLTTNAKLIMGAMGNIVNMETSFKLDANESMGNYIWSPDEKRMVFAKFKRNDDNELISMDYLILDTESGTIITFRKDELEYLNFRLITNDEVILGDTSYSLADGEVLPQIEAE